MPKAEWAFLAFIITGGQKGTCSLWENWSRGNLFAFASKDEGISFLEEKGLIAGISGKEHSARRE